MTDCFWNWTYKEYNEKQRKRLFQNNGKNYSFFNIKMLEFQNESLAASNSFHLRYAIICQDICPAGKFEKLKFRKFQTVFMCHYLVWYLSSRIPSEVRPETGAHIFPKSGRIQDRTSCPVQPSILVSTPLHLRPFCIKNFCCSIIYTFHISTFNFDDVTNSFNEVHNDDNL